MAVVHDALSSLRITSFLLNAMGERVTSMSSKHGVGLVVVSVVLALTPGAARATGGTVLAWGCGGGNDFGQCTVPSGLSGVTAIAAGLSHSLALKSDGTVVDW